MTPDDPRHGTVTAYTNLRCRCAACRDGWAAYTRAYRQRKRQARKVAEKDGSRPA